MKYVLKKDLPFVEGDKGDQVIIFTNKTIQPSHTRGFDIVAGAVRLWVNDEKDIKELISAGWIEEVKEEEILPSKVTFMIMKYRDLIEKNPELKKDLAKYFPEIRGNLFTEEDIKKYRESLNVKIANSKWNQDGHLGKPFTQPPREEKQPREWFEIEGTLEQEFWGRRFESQPEAKQYMDIKKYPGGFSIIKVREVVE